MKLNSTTEIANVFVGILIVFGLVFAVADLNKTINPDTSAIEKLR